MENNNLKQLAIIWLTKLGWRILTAVILASVAGGTIWLFAAFTEPSAGPADSDQDFGKNILGADNADNDFDSSAVTANDDGSIIERLEDIQTNHAGVCGDGTKQANEMCDDGNNSWTTGVCAANCTRVNSWANPKFGTFTIATTDNTMLTSWCAQHTITYSWTAPSTSRTYSKSYTFSTYLSVAGDPAATQIWCY